MIRYALKCAEGHAFESWFQSADAYDALAAKGLVNCAICGSPDVAKAMMAPRVGASDPSDSLAPAALSGPTHPAEEVLKAMREHVEQNSTYVGGNFAREARAMHVGDVPDKPIHGEANAAEAKALIEDGVPILPLPGPPRSKTN
ncbi:DUF1178 family protein [Gymnodinialimonas sp. 2305UL16-5]|uniref:DUF1178 family protein n=1 Tax=Gymnodinialimonas mytili TaxID=3126503 RepID=UPI0030B2DF13